MDIRIHAGNLKTGSTSIQGFLRQNLAALNASGQIYIPALTQNPAAHATLARQLGAEESLREKNPNWDQIRNEILVEAASTVPILLTNEIFIRVPAQRLKDRLDSLFGKPEVHLYFYLRPHIEMVTASYLQEIKTGFLRARLPRVINKLLTRREIDFCPVIEEFKAVFGAGHVHCRDYAREHFPSGNVLQDIPDFFKLPVLGDPALVAPSGMQNISPGAEAAALLLHLRQFLPEAPERNAYLRFRDLVFNPLNVALALHLAPGYVTRCLPPVDMQARIKEQFEPGRQALARRFDMQPLSAKWCDEPLRRPETPKNPPLALVQSAIAQVVERLEMKQSGLYTPLLRKVVETLPAEQEGGVTVVSLERLRPLRHQ